MARSRELKVIISGDPKSLTRSLGSADKALGKHAGMARRASRTISGANTRTSRSYDHMAGRSHRAGGRVIATNRRINQSMAGMAKRAALTGAGFAGAYLSIAGGRKAINTTVALAKTTLALSKTLGMSVKSASEWASVASSRDVQGKALVQSFGILSKQVSAAKDEGSEAAKTFRELGISQDDLKKGSTDFNFLLGKVSDGLHGIKRGSDRATPAMKLLGRGWQSVFPVLRDGSKEMEKNLAIANKFGATFGGKSLKSMEDFIAKQREMKFASMGLQIAFTTAVTPALTKLMDKAGQVSKVMNDKKLTGEEKWRKIQTILEPLGEKLVKSFEDAAPKIADAAADAAPEVASAFWKAFKNMGTGGKLLTGALLLRKLGGASLFAGVGRRMGAGLGRHLAGQLAARFGPALRSQGGRFGRAIDGVLRRSSATAGRRAGTLAGHSVVVSAGRSVSQRRGRLTSSVDGTFRKVGRSAGGAGGRGAGAQMVTSTAGMVSRRRGRLTSSVSSDFRRSGRAAGRAGGQSAGIGMSRTAASHMKKTSGKGGVMGKAFIVAGAAGAALFMLQFKQMLPQLVQMVKDAAGMLFPESAGGPPGAQDTEAAMTWLRKQGYKRPKDMSKAPGMAAARGWPGRDPSSGLPPGYKQPGDPGYKGRHAGGLIQKFATGGRVRGKDDVPIMAQAGEFMVRRKAVRKLGVPAMRQINRGELPATTAPARGAEQGTKKAEQSTKKSTRAIRRESTEMRKSLDKDGKQIAKRTDKHFDDTRKRSTQSMRRTRRTVGKDFDLIRRDGDRDMRLLARRTARHFGSIQVDVGQSTRKARRVLGRDFDAMRSSATKSSRSIERTVSTRMGRTAKSAGISSRRLASGIRAGMGSADAAVHKGMSYIGRATAAGLKAFDAEKGFKFSVPTPAIKAARGGVIGGWGQKGRDKVHAVLGKGEAVLTRHHQRPVEHALRKTYGVGLKGLFGRQKRKHYMAEGGYAGEPQGFAAGGIADASFAGAGGRSVQVARWLLPFVKMSQKRWGAGMTAGFDPGGGHQSAGHNVTGEAMDWIAGSKGWGRQGIGGQALWSVPRASQVLYDGQWGTTAYPNHGEGNHIHIDFSGKKGTLKGMGAGGWKKIKRLLVGGPEGGVRSIAQGSLDKVTGAANKFGSKKESETVGVAADGKVPPGGLRAWLTKALKITGHYSKANLAGLMKQAMSESGGDPNAINLTDSNAAAGTPSIGLLQTIGPTFDAYKLPGMGNIRNPVHNAVAAIRYMFARYGHIVSTGSGYDEGGFAGNVMGGDGGSIADHFATGGYVGGDVGSEFTEFGRYSSGARSGNARSGMNIFRSLSSLGGRGKGQDQGIERLTRYQDLTDEDTDTQGGRNARLAELGQLQPMLAARRLSAGRTLGLRREVFRRRNARLKVLKGRLKRSLGRYGSLKGMEGLWRRKGKTRAGRKWRKSRAGKAFLRRLRGVRKVSGLVTGQQGRTSSAAESLDEAEDSYVDADIASREAGAERAALNAAQDANTEAIREQTEVLRELQGEVKRQNSLHDQVASITTREATRILADIVSNQVGVNVGQRAATAGSGVRARF